MLCANLLLGSSAFSQVSIGSPSPNTNSILDLTNSDNLGLRLPTVGTASALKPSPNGLLYYFNNNMYLRTSGGYNAISPWRYKYNLTTSENVYLPSTIGNVGIGTATPAQKLDVAGNINTTGKVMEGGNNLIPSGTIVMWYGAGMNVPAGWKICDGTNGTPNLINKFPYGVAEGGAMTTGGNNNQTLITANLPSHAHGAGSLSTAGAGSHSHTGTTNTDGAHTHQFKGWWHTNTTDGSEEAISNYYVSSDPATSGSMISSGSHSHYFSTSSEPNHTHTISGSTGNVGSGTSFDNRPEYATVLFIMKE